MIGVSTHDALAARLDDDPAGRPLLVVLDARRGEVYVQGFDPAGKPLMAIEARDPSDLAADLVTVSWRLVGPGAHLIADRLDASTPVEILDAQPADAAAVARAAMQRLSAGEPPSPGFGLKPLYIRSPDAVPPTPLIASATALATRATGEALP